MLAAFAAIGAAPYEKVRSAVVDVGGVSTCPPGQWFGKARTLKRRLVHFPCGFAGKPVKNAHGLTPECPYPAVMSDTHFGQGSA
jgi:hypothetical protein